MLMDQDTERNLSQSVPITDLDEKHKEEREKWLLAIGGITYVRKRVARAI